MKDDEDYQEEENNDEKNYKIVSLHVKHLGVLY